MKLAAKYYGNTLRNSFLTAFGVILGLMLFSGLFLRSSYNDDADYSISGFELTFMIFTLVTGLVAFRETFRFFQQNGISRKSQFMGWSISLAALSLMEAVVSLVMELILRQFFHYRGIYSQLYQPLRYPEPTLLFLVQELLWIFAACLVLGWAGFAITLLYYRLPKTGKILVSILTPGTLFILLPMADKPLLRGGYSWLLQKFSMLISGYLPNGIYPMVPVVTALVCSVLLAGISWLMMHRAEVRA